MIKKLLIILFILLFSIFLIFFLNYYNHTKMIKKVSNIFQEVCVQNNIQDIKSISDLSIQVNELTVVGIIKIEKINFEGLVYEGTSSNILEKGVGHFECSPLTKGNICLAAHNTNKFWAKLNILQIGDIITYENILGTKDYKVFSSTQIEETDISYLENTKDNILTLITCVKNIPDKRLCVQAIEI